MFTTSVLLYYLRPTDDDENFTSIPATFYIALLMLCGQGEPEGALPWYTKVVVAITACFSIAFFAIPASMLTWGFEAEAERLFHRAVDRRRKRRQAIAEGRADSYLSDSTEDDDFDEDEVPHFDHQP